MDDDRYTTGKTTKETRKERKTLLRQQSEEYERTKWTV